MKHKNYDFSSISNWIKNNKKTTLFLCIGLALRIAISIYVLYNGLYEVADTASYLEPAKSFLASGKLFVGGKADLLRTPVYPLFLSFCLLFTEKAMPIVAVVLQQVLGLLVFFIWRKWLSDYITNEKIKSLFEAIYLFNIISIYYACILITDFLFQLGLILLCYELHKYWKTSSVKYAVISGGILALLILLRPVAMYLPLALFAGMVFVALFNKANKKKAFISAVSLLLCSASLPCAWAGRNYYYTSEFTISNIADINLYAYNAPAIESELTGRSYYDINSERIAQGLTDEGLEQAMQLISDNKARYIKKYIVGIGMQFVYPGINDVARSIDAVDEGIQYIKSELTGNKTLVDKVLSCAQYCFSDNIIFLLFVILMLIDVLLLLVCAVGFICFVFSNKVTIKWYEKWMLIGIIAYFVVCCAAPVGYGSYPRFRVSFVYLVFICISFYTETIIKIKKSMSCNYEK